MADFATVPVLDRPLRGSIRPPGSKSLTNRALIVSALAHGQSRLTGVLDSQDTRVMVDSLQRLGIKVTHDRAGCTADVDGCSGQIPASAADLWLENSGTSIRFLTALCALGNGRYRLDGNERMRERPIGELGRALEQLGAKVTCELGTDCPPVVVESHGLAGGNSHVPGSISSQYLSALLMAAPAARGPVDIHIDGTLVSEPYIDMTLGVMAQFGVEVGTSVDGQYRIRPTPYRANNYDIEPDASAASYFFAAAAVTGGEITVEGLNRWSLQGDVRFVEALERMGCDVVYGQQGITVKGKPLHGIDIDMNAISDTAQTLAAVAPFAEGPTRIHNVRHMRFKETDRITALSTELRRLGLQVEETEDSLTIHPGPMKPARIATYNDHRMAMSFALVGLRLPGLEIADPECTHKTYPGFFDDLNRLARG
ncbi:MAG TPA: 3-phosphoshikimate 1-carboxyvinyltransferase [Planctomycetaceae bacterium]|nr:3-phosphoshikimate 1-carboxyvinyltransferase [Planctomycetaceae bacterium]